MELQPLYWMTRWWIPLVVFVSALGACHFLFLWWPWRLGKDSWKRVDYVWLTMTFISIIGLVSQSRQTLSSTYVPFAADQVRFHAQDIESDLAFSAHLNCDFPKIKGPNSPPNFDDMVKQENEYCAQLKGLQHTLEQRLSGGQKIDYDVSRDTEYPLADDFKNQRARLKSDVDAYNKSVDKLQELQGESRRSVGEEFLMLLAPFLIALALALRMTKVTADLRPEKQTTGSIATS